MAIYQNSDLKFRLNNSIVWMNKLKMAADFQDSPAIYSHLIHSSAAYLPGRTLAINTPSIAFILATISGDTS